MLTSPILLLSLAVILGFVLGEIRLGGFKLGVSGILFAGMGIAWALNNWGVTDSGLVVNKAYFDFLLVLFLVSAGLLAAKDVAKVFRGNGLKLFALTLVVACSGALAVYGLFMLIPALDRQSISGVFTGSITSSPGLAIALEAAGKSPVPGAAAAVGLGYALTYPFSVVIVITSMRLIPRLFGIDLQREATLLVGDTPEVSEIAGKSTHPGLDMTAFALVCAVGVLVGRLYIPLGSLGRLSLETTGGILVAALIFGNMERLGPLNFRMNPGSLNALQQVSVAFIFAYVGLSYGHQAVEALRGPAILMVAIGLVCTSSAVMMGFLLGRYVFKLNWIVLSGAICGAMTSTPGLGAAMESTGNTQTAGAYGSTYPIGLLTKVLIVLLMSALK